MTLPAGFEISCTPSELFCLAGLLGADSLVGVADPFLGWLTEEVNDEMAKAREALAARKILAVESGDRIVVDVAAAALAGTVATPQASFTLTMNEPGNSAVQRSFYWHKPMTVELVPGADGRYHLCALESGGEIRTRIPTIWKIKAQRAVRGETLSVPESSLDEARRLLDSKGPSAAAQVLTRAGALEGPARALIASIAEPIANGAVVALRRQGTDWEVAGLGMLLGKNGLWRLRSFSRGGEPWIEAAPCSAKALTAEIGSLVNRFVPVKDQ
jgi:hypothetical protein